MIASVALRMIAREDAGLVRTLIVRHAEIGAKPLAETCGGHLSHDEAAATVRMLDRRDMAHEAVCMIARDRIVWLAARLAAAEQALTEERSRGAQLAKATRSLAMGFTNERVADVVDALKPYNGAPA